MLSLYLDIFWLLRLFVCHSTVSLSLCLLFFWTIYVIHMLFENVWMFYVAPASQMQSIWNNQQASYDAETRHTEGDVKKIAMPIWYINHIHTYIFTFQGKHTKTNEMERSGTQTITNRNQTMVHQKNIKNKINERNQHIFLASFSSSSCSIIAHASSSRNEFVESSYTMPKISYSLFWNFNIRSICYLNTSGVLFYHKIAMMVVVLLLLFFALPFHSNQYNILSLSLSVSWRTPKIFYFILCYNISQLFLVLFATHEISKMNKIRMWKHYNFQLIY